MTFGFSIHHSMKSSVTRVFTIKVFVCFTEHNAINDAWGNLDQFIMFNVCVCL